MAMHCTFFGTVALGLLVLLMPVSSTVSVEGPPLSQNDENNSFVDFAKEGVKLDTDTGILSSENFASHPTDKGFTTSYKEPFEQEMSYADRELQTTLAQCKAFLARSDNDPRDIAIDQAEYVKLVNRVTEDYWEGVTSFGDLPVELQENFNGLSVSGKKIDISGVWPDQPQSERQDMFLQAVCDSTAVAIEKAMENKSMTPQPTENEPDAEPAALAQTELRKCFLGMSLADRNKDDELDRGDYVLFINLLGNAAWAGFSYNQLPAVLRGNFVTLAGPAEDDTIDVFGSKRGQEPSDEQQQFLERVCAQTDQAIEIAMNGPETPAPSPAPSPPEETLAPTAGDTLLPTASPTLTVETLAPTETEEEPSASPTVGPTLGEPTESPTVGPTLGEPTESPTEGPTLGEPTESPTEEPSESPTSEPTESPTSGPTESPSFEPTESPTEGPSFTPTTSPTLGPTVSPLPTEQPTSTPSPTVTPSPTAEATPTASPSVSPSAAETPTTPTPPPSGGDISPTRKPILDVPGAFVISNTAGLTAAQLGSSQLRQQLNIAYRETAEQVVAATTISRQLLNGASSNHHRRLEVEFVNSDIGIIRDVECPSNVPDGALCQDFPFASFQVDISNAEASTEDIFQQLNSEMLTAIDDGTMQDNLDEIAPDNPIVIEQGSRPGAPTPAPTNAPDDGLSGGAKAGIVIFSLGAVAVLAIGCWYYNKNQMEEEPMDEMPPEELKPKNAPVATGVVVATALGTPIIKDDVESEVHDSESVSIDADSEGSSKVVSQDKDVESGIHSHASGSIDVESDVSSYKAVPQDKDVESGIHTHDSGSVDEESDVSSNAKRKDKDVESGIHTHDSESDASDESPTPSAHDEKVGFSGTYDFDGAPAQDAAAQDVANEMESAEYSSHSSSTQFESEESDSEESGSVESVESEESESEEKEKPSRSS